jgi:hypothetical protein
VRRCTENLAQKLLQKLVIDRLDEMVLETGLA